MYILNCTTSRSLQKEKVTIDFTWPDNGYIFQGTSIGYIDGKAKIPHHFDLYLLKVDEEGSYRISRGTHHKNWY